jgi:hypothetical protein
VISARYRDAFEGGWQTPKVTTGLTYEIDRQNSVTSATPGEMASQ